MGGRPGGGGDSESVIPVVLLLFLCPRSKHLKVMKDLKLKFYRSLSLHKPLGGTFSILAAADGCGALTSNSAPTCSLQSPQLQLP